MLTPELLTEMGFVTIYDYFRTIVDCQVEGSEAKTHWLITQMCKEQKTQFKDWLLSLEAILEYPNESLRIATKKCIQLM